MSAEFDATFKTTLTVSGEGTFIVGEHEIGLFHAVVVVTVEVDATFKLGDVITVTGDSIYTYVGHFAGGWIGVDGDGHHFLFSRSEFEVDREITIDVTPFPACFLAGTLIATPTGERPVESLAIGDLVTTPDGTARPVRWIGRQVVVAVFAEPLHDFPVRIAAGALADGLPSRDLFVSPDHALLLDGLLVQAGALVNGVTITRVREPAPHFTYFHIELEDHALVLAEGQPAETFVDNASRRRFDNWAEYEALAEPAAVQKPEIALPRIKSARQLPQRLRARLAARAAAAAVPTAA